MKIEKTDWEDGMVLEKRHLNDFNEFVLRSVANVNTNVVFGIDPFSDKLCERSDNIISIYPFFAIFKSGYQVVSNRPVLFSIDEKIADKANYVYLVLTQSSEKPNSGSFKLVPVQDFKSTADNLVFSKWELSKKSSNSSTIYIGKAREFIYPIINLFKNDHLDQLHKFFLESLSKILKNIAPVKFDNKYFFFYNQLYASIANVIGNLKKAELIKMCTPTEFYFQLMQIVFLVDSFPGQATEYSTIEIINNSFNFNDSYISFEKIKHWIKKIETKRV